MLVLALAGIAALVWTPLLIDIQRSSRLVGEGRIAVGAITSTDCAYHGSILYAFQPSAADPPVRDAAKIRKPNCSEARPGDPISVVYVASEPNAETLGDPRDTYAGDLALLVLSVLAVVLLATIGAVRQLIRSRRARSD